MHFSTNRKLQPKIYWYLKSNVKYFDDKNWYSQTCLIYIDNYKLLNMYNDIISSVYNICIIVPLSTFYLPVMKITNQSLSSTEIVPYAKLSTPKCITLTSIFSQLLNKKYC